MVANRCDFFTIDKIFGVTKVHKVTKDMLTAVRAFDEANEKLYNKLMSVMKENEQLKKKLDIALKALKKYESAAGWGREAFLAVKEIEEVKE